MRLGADPEVFLQDKTGKHISSIGFIGANKWAPLQIPDMPQGFTLQEDNVSLEYGIPPAATEDEFVHHIQAVMNKSKEYVKGLSFSKLSCVIFPDDQLANPMAHVFGCEPDYNAWTKKENSSPQPPNPNMRSAGGHIHVETDKDPILIGRNMDLCLSIPAIFMDENGIERKEFYGKSGAIRFKPYGLEYRSLSNFWIFDEKYIRWAWRNTARALELGDISKLRSKVTRAINTNNKNIAEQLIKEYDLEVV